MNIDDSVLQKLEKLSMISIQDEKKREIEGQLSEILSFVENLNSIDTDNISATFNTLNGGTPLREDEALNSDVSEEILKNSPKNEDGFFIVPKIIE